MAELLLINPRKRRKARKASKRRTRKSYVRRAAPVVRVRRKARKASRRRRRNPVSFRAVRRRSNPIKLPGVLSGLVPMVKNAAIGAVGSIGVDYAMGMVNRYLPDSLKTVPGKVTTGDAVKVVFTVALGRLLSRATRGMSVTAAQGALTVQMDRIARTLLPDTVKAQLAYAAPARVVMGTQRVAPNRLAAYTAPGQTALLSAYTRSGAASPLLNAARSREGFRR